MADEKGRKVRSNKRLGVASYAGREGRVHFFSIAYDDGTTELLTVPLLRARVAKEGKRSVAVSTKYKIGDLPAQPNAEDMQSWLEQTMPGHHAKYKVEALLKAVQEDNVGSGGVTSHDVDLLCAAVEMNDGATFLPWEWGTEATEALRRQGCRLRVNKDRGTFRPALHASFIGAGVAGVKMTNIIFSLEDAVTDAVLPVACEFASSLVVARVSLQYISMGDGARVDWLKRVQQRGCLGIIKGEACIWLVVCRSPQMKQAHMQGASGERLC